MVPLTQAQLQLLARTLESALDEAFQAGLAQGRRRRAAAPPSPPQAPAPDFSTK